MKKLFIAFAAVACALSSCSDDNTAEDTSRNSITISTNDIPAAPDGVTTQIEVTSSGDWRVSGVCEWARVSAVSGKSGDTVTVTVDPNDTDFIRETTFKFFTGSVVAPLKIVSEPGYSLELLSDADVILEEFKTTVSVKVHTNIPELECTFSDKGDEWITYKGRAEVFGNTVLNFEIAANKTYDNRSTVLTISGMDQVLPISFMQKQVNEILVEPESFDFDLGEQSFSVDVSANVEYTVTISDNWIQQVETRGLETKKFNFHVDAAAATRGGTITISGAGITRKITVIQKDPDAVAVMIPDANFRNHVAGQGWVLDLGANLCVVTETGLNATTLQYNPGWSNKIQSLEGIEAFPELTTVDVSGNNLKLIDLSKLTKVTSLNFSDNDYLATVILGSNPITELSMYNGSYDYIYNFTTLTIAGEKLVSLNVAMTSWYAAYDELEAVDVSGCPALETLDCRRGDSLKTLYLKQGQVIPNLTKNDVTQIVYK